MLMCMWYSINLYSSVLYGEEINTCTLSLYFFSWQIVSQKPHLSDKFLLHILVIFIQFWVQYIPSEILVQSREDHLILCKATLSQQQQQPKKKQEEVHPTLGFKNLEISSLITNTQYVQIKSWFSCHIYFFIFDDR